uniref:Uncharacterized protein n=1 Tax=Cyclopterus lumpus TaxID=8103 RepID=A0A8C2WQ43_CYCLU
MLTVLFYVSRQETQKQSGSNHQSSAAASKQHRRLQDPTRVERRRRRRKRGLERSGGCSRTCVKICQNYRKINVSNACVRQVPVNPALYLIKYEGFDCVYGLELHKDDRVQGLEVRSMVRMNRHKVTPFFISETMIGKAVEHMFETEEGPKEEWRGMVLARAPIMTTWFYITYEKDPVLYMYQLLDDYKEGDLRIMPDSNDGVPAEREPGEVVDSLVGKQVEYAKEDGGKRTGMVIHQVEAKPSVYFIKFDDDFLIYVYDLVKTL